MPVPRASSRRGGDGLAGLVDQVRHCDVYQFGCPGGRSVRKPVATLNTTGWLVDEHPVVSNANAASTMVRLRALIVPRTLGIRRSKKVS